MQHSDLKELLNDESFIRWLNDEAAIEEQQRWDRWLDDDPEREVIVKKAKRIVTMPFMENDSSDMEQELRDLQKRSENQKRIK